MKRGRFSKSRQKAYTSSTGRLTVMLRFVRTIPSCFPWLASVSGCCESWRAAITSSAVTASTLSVANTVRPRSFSGFASVLPSSARSSASPATRDHTALAMELVESRRRVRDLAQPP
jgi:hypothetical protein